MPPDEPRFLTLADVAEVLNTSSAQVYALVRRKELPAVKLGGRGQWRVERDKLEAFIAQLYDETSKWVDEHPFAGDDETAGGDGWLVLRSSDASSSGVEQPLGSKP